MDFNTKIQDNTAAVQSGAGGSQVQTTGAGNSSAPNTVFDTKSSTSQINEELLKKILEKYPDFLTKTQEEQAKILNEFSNADIPNPNLVVQQQEELSPEENKILNHDSIDNQSVASEQYDENIPFNHKDFKAKTNQEKLEIYKKELAKNLGLSEDDQSLNDKITEFLGDDICEKVSNTGDKRAKLISKLLERKMLELQAANNAETKIDDFYKQSSGLDKDGNWNLNSQEQIIHEYLFKFENEGILTDEMLLDIKEKEPVSEVCREIIKEYLELNSDELDKETISNLESLANNKDAIMAYDEMIAHLKPIYGNDISDNEVKQQLIQVTLNTKTDIPLNVKKNLESQLLTLNAEIAIEKGLTDDDIEKYKKNYDKFTENDLFKNFENAKNDNDRLSVIRKYVHKNFRDLPKEDQQVLQYEIIKGYEYSQTQPKIAQGLLTKFYDTFVGTDNEKFGRFLDKLNSGVILYVAKEETVCMNDMCRLETIYGVAKRCCG